GRILCICAAERADCPGGLIRLVGSASGLRHRQPPVAQRRGAYAVHGYRRARRRVRSSRCTCAATVTGMRAPKAVEYWNAAARFGPDAAVIDRADTRGYKNRYIAQLRDRAIAGALASLPPGARLLDFGCGSGSVSRLLADREFVPIGID